jgi:OOP family OmpA-OmpF porin
MRTRHIIPLLIAAPLAFAGLTACDTTTSLTELRQILPKDDPYAVALSGMYRDYAEAELTAYDWWSSKRFADKGLMVARGEQVEPENPADWAISPQARPELDRARTSLMEALASPAKAAHPQAAASALFHYDCWVENLDDGWQESDIASCRDHFFASLTALQADNPPLPAGEGRGEGSENGKTPQASSPHPTPGGEEISPDSTDALPTGATTDNSEPSESEETTAPTEIAPTPEASETPSPMPEVASSMVLYFPFDDAVLESKLLPEVEGLIASLKAHPETTLVINGHADRAGTDQYNLALSAHRAEYMRKLLIKNGIDPKRVEYYAFGESDPAIPTPDGERLRANRRVEIFLE